MALSNSIDIERHSAGKSRAEWKCKVNMAASDAQTAVTFIPSCGRKGGLAEAMKMLWSLESIGWKGTWFDMEHANEGDQIQQWDFAERMASVLAPKDNQKLTWIYDKKVDRK